MKVVGFQIEIKGQKDILNTTKVLGLLNTQLILINNTLKEIDKNSGKSLSKLTKQFDKTGDSAGKLGKVVKDSFSSFKKGNKIVSDLGNGYLEVTKEVKKASKEIAQNEKALESDTKSVKDLINRNKELKKELLSQPLGKQSAAVKKLGQEYAKNNDVIKDFRKELRTGKKASEANAGSLDELRKTAIKLKKQYNALGDEQRKTFEGKKIQKSLLATQKRIQKLDLAVKDGRTSIGLYGNATRKVGQTLLKLSVGRDIIRGLFQGLAGIVEKNKDIDESAKSISTTFDKLKGAAEKFGLLFIRLVAGPLEAFVGVAESVSVAMFGVSFGAEKASEGVRNLQTEFNAEIEVLKRGNLSTEARSQLISDINTKYKEYLPNLIKESDSIDEITTAQDAANKAFEKKFTLLASEEQFVALTKRRLDASREEVVLQRELTKALEEEIRTRASGNAVGKTGVNISNVNSQNRIANIKAEIAVNKERLNAIQEEEGILKDVLKVEGITTEDFVSNQEVKTDAELKGIKKRESARAKARQKELDQLAADRARILEEARNSSLARIKLINDLSNKLTAAQIVNVKDATDRAIQAENERFRLETEARKENSKARLEEVAEQRKEIERLFVDGSEERKNFESKADSELKQIQAINDRIAEEKEKQHQNNLIKIAKDANQVLIDTEKKRNEDIEKVRESARQKLRANRKARIAQEKKDADDAAALRKERLQEALDTTQSISDTAFNAIAEFTTLANDNETARLDSAIQARQDSLNNLNEQLASATGLQKKFLEQQVKNEKKALEEEQKQREKSEKERVKSAQTLALIQAIINGAIAITRAFSDLGPIAGAIAAVGVAAGIAAQIATIASQKFEKGGVLSGPSHAGGGIPVEAEGGEAIINKRSTSRHRALLSAINVDGGGVSFASGGLLGAPISAPTNIGSRSSDNAQLQNFASQFDRRTQALEGMLLNLTVTQDLNNLQDIEENDINLNVQTTL